VEYEYGTLLSMGGRLTLTRRLPVWKKAKMLTKGNIEKLLSEP